MSRDITTLANTDLPIKNERKLMEELSSRFNANVYLGFITGYNWTANNFNTFLSQGLIDPSAHEPNVEAYLLDVLETPGTTKFINLIVEDYEHYYLYEKYGDDVATCKELEDEFGVGAENNIRYIKNVLEEFPRYSFCFDKFCCDIYKESIEVGPDHFFGGWLYFYAIISRELEEVQENYQHLLDLMNTNRTAIKKLGGNCAYYFDDQGNYTGNVGQGNEWSMTWQEIHQNFNSGKAGKHQINLVDALTDEDYFLDIRRELIEYPRDHSVFYDDFREIKLDNIIDFS